MDTMEEKADLFVEKLLTEGAQIACDDSETSFKKTKVDQDDLPPFYDEGLFKKGQQFYHKNIFAIFGGKIYGLMSVLAIPTILRILVHTKQSGTEYTAYRRYVSTILHMTIWYDSEFKPGSKLWKSISQVKSLHNSASNSGCQAGLNRISQRDMALTQFGFMGYQLVRSKQLGVYYATNEEWQAFIHVWRVIGYLLGIEDRFNICKGSVAETKAICEKLIERAFIPNINKKDPEFIEMSQYLCRGLWAIQPFLNFDVLWFLLNCLLVNKMNMTNDNENYKKLTFKQKILLYVVCLTISSLKFAPFRWFHNNGKYRDLWLIKNFPFLAYYKFGFSNTKVKHL
ncbi:uncharacterized protein LOC126735472 [Anthonomus grandis grandis]|uniref:uncharacterized protein LOC126735472 n=1 Tax=Anthonomus grandis grandis TaxID=2921223 RepID=UPI0021655EF5|nr:uncharacterized protein LOC126735472 [Anthonomus grandis grandis]XP_050295428.1 uncharacterized protein LOC126735472 [Anthonomus grandis grandis]XP_050295429.1 uncharacterized protein LOC126735472 [Anthonomus grandis grandis]